MEWGLDMLLIFIIFSKTNFKKKKKALTVLVRPPESKLYLLKHCNIVHDAMMAALLLSRLVALQGRGYHQVPDHPELHRTAGQPCCRVWTLPHLTSTQDAASKLAPMALNQWELLHQHSHPHQVSFCDPSWANVSLCCLQRWSCKSCALQWPGCSWLLPSRLIWCSDPLC